MNNLEMQTAKCKFVGSWKLALFCAIGLIIEGCIGSARAAVTDFCAWATVGDNRNAGSTTNAAPLIELTGGNVSGSVFTKAGANLSAVTAGMWASLYADGATQAVYVAKITAVDDGADTITVSATDKMGTSPGNGTGNRSIRVGGAWWGFNGPNDFPFNLVQATAVNAANEFAALNLRGTFFATDTITNTAPGVIIVQGYTNVFRDKGKAIIDGKTGTAGVVFSLFGTSSAANNWIIRDLEFDGNFAGSPAAATATGNWGVSIGGVGSYVQRVIVKNMWRGGLRADAAIVTVTELDAHTNNRDDASDFGGFLATEEGTLSNSFIHDNDDLGSDNDNLGIVLQLASGEPYNIFNCIVVRNTKHNLQIQGSAASVNVWGSTFWECDDNNIHSTGTGASAILVRNSILGGAGLYNINRSTAVDGSITIEKCAMLAGGSGNLNNINSSFATDTITLSGDPFVNKGADNWTPNDPLIKNTGWGQIGALAVLSYPDVGAVQHQDAGGGGSAGTAYLIVR